MMLGRSTALFCIATVLVAGCGGTDGEVDELRRTFDCDRGELSRSWCGGDPSGEWTYMGVCDGNALDRLQTMCRVGQYHMDGTPLVGTWHLSDEEFWHYWRRTEFSTLVRVRVEAECLAELGDGRCRADNIGLRGGTCTQRGSRCECERQNSWGAAREDARSSTVTGSRLEYGSRYYRAELDFCVAGDTMIHNSDSEPLRGLIFVLRR